MRPIHTYVKSIEPNKVINVDLYYLFVQKGGASGLAVRLAIIGHGFEFH